MSSVETFCLSQKEAFSSFVLILNDHKCSQITQSDEINKLVLQTVDKQRLLNDDLKKAQEILNAVSLQQKEIVSNELESV